MKNNIYRRASYLVKQVNHLLIYIALTLLLAGCTSYQSFAVRTSASDYQSIILPAVTAIPVIQDPSFNIYEDAQSKERYFVVPTTLAPIEADRGTVWSIGLERSDGNHLVLITILGPRANLLQVARSSLLANSLNVKSVEYYPIEHLTIRPLTDPRVPSQINYTAVAAPGLTLTPFHIKILVQAKSFDNIIALKEMVNSDVGILFECGYVLRKVNNGVIIDELLTAKAALANMEVTSLSM